MNDQRKFGQFWLLTAAVTLFSLTACNSNENKPDESNAGEVKKTAYARSGFACCNLHYEGDWISDSNFSQLAFIPAGTPINVKKIDGYQVFVEIDGKPMRLGQDNGREQETIEQWMNKMVVLEDTKLKIAKFTPPIRKAIEVGKLMKGMTKEQVIIAVGYPQTNETPKLDGTYWRYWWSSYGPYYVYWSGNKVSKINGHSETVASMTYKTK